MVFSKLQGQASNIRISWYTEIDLFNIFCFCFSFFSTSNIFWVHTGIQLRFEPLPNILLLLFRQLLLLILLFLFRNFITSETVWAYFYRQKHIFFNDCCAPTWPWVFCATTTTVYDSGFQPGFRGTRRLNLKSVALYRIRCWIVKTNLHLIFRHHFCSAMCF